MRKRMGKVLKKLVAGMLAILLVATTNAIPVKAAVSGMLAYEIVSGEVIITDCDIRITGVLEIPETIEGYPVTSIGAYAFGGCSGLTSIIVPEGIKTIGDYAFGECNGVTSISIPTSVTSIGASAFSACGSLTSVTIPEGVTSIGKNTFYGCSSLTTVSIPKSVTSIGASAFYGCSSLEEVIIPSGVTSIGEKAFYNCSALTKLVIPSGVASISNATFYGCSNLVEVSIPSGVTSIGQNAFYNCSSLASVNIPASVTSIGSAAFNGCSSMTEIHIPAGVTSIANSTFNGCESLTSISIPEGVTNIGNYAFCGCSSLTEINIPSGVVAIGKNCFSYCENIETVTIPETVKTIDAYAFSYCSSIKNVVVPEGVTSIGKYAFSECSDLTSVELPVGITCIDKGTFASCINLTSVNIPEGVTSIGENAFGGCNSLTNIQIPSGVTSIGNLAFARCSSLESVEIPDGVTTIGSGAFQECSSLTDVTIPQSVTSIGEEAFFESNQAVIYTTSEYVKDYANGYRVDYVWITDKIEIMQLPHKINYGLNEEFSGEGLILLAYHGEVSEEVISGYEISGFDSSQLGVCTITVVYNEQVATFDITIHDYSEWQVLTVPSYVSEGEQERVCNLCGHKDTETIDKYVATAVTLSQTEISMDINNSVTIGLTCTPYEPVAGDVIWTSSNDSVATVENGIVTAVGGGTATITATVGEVSASCEVKVVYPLQISSAALQLEKDITIIFRTKSEMVDGVYTGVYAIVTQELENGETRTQKIEAVKRGDGTYYEFKYTGLAAKEAGDLMDITIYGYRDGELVTGETKEDYGIMSYCLNQLGKAASDLGLSESKTAAFKTLLVDIINYASEAQIYFGYKTDALVVDQLTEEQKALASDDSALADLKKVTNANYKTIENPSVIWKSATIQLLSRATIRMKAIYAGNIENVTLYAQVAGETYEVTEYDLVGTDVYYFYFNEITAFQFGEVVEFYFMEGDTVVSNTLLYSVESYATSKLEDAIVGNVVSAMMKYGKAAVAYGEAR